MGRRGKGSLPDTLKPENVEIAREQGLEMSPGFGEAFKDRNKKKRERDAKILKDLENLTLLPVEADVPEFIRQQGGYVMWRRKQLKNIPEKSIFEYKEWFLYELEINKRSIAEIVTLPGMASYKWIVNERKRDPDFDREIRLIQEHRALELRDFLIDVIKNPPMTEEYNAETGITVKKVDPVALQHKKIAADIARWLMSKELRTAYGDNVKIESEAVVNLESIDKFAQIGIVSLDTEEEYQGVIEKRLANLNPEIAGLMSNGEED